MSTKALNINQHIMLHQLYPDNCCLCKAEERIKVLEKQLQKNTPEEHLENKYLNNLCFHAIVDHLYDGIINKQFSLSDLQDAIEIIEEKLRREK